MISVRQIGQREIDQIVDACLRIDFIGVMEVLEVDTVDEPTERFQQMLFTAIIVTGTCSDSQLKSISRFIVNVLSD